MAPVEVALDPVYAAFCEQAKHNPKFSDGSIPLPAFREAANQRLKGVKNLPEVIEEDKVVVHNSIDVRLTLFRPPGTENEILPAVVFYHGGGWVFGSKYTHGKLVKDICVRNNVAVVFVDYPLAPESKYPAAHENAFAALSWVVENGDSINVDVSRLAVCGDSAGGNLSAVIPLMAKERGLPSAIKAQILLYPATAASRDKYESAKLFGGGDYYLKNEDAIFFDKAYWNDCEKTKIGFPMLATTEELQGLPPALIFTAEADILRDEGEDYARRLTNAGVPNATVRVIGAIHGYATVPVDTPAYKQTMAMITNQLSEAFEKK
ncbi:alpha/beta hydrolase fold-domain-containing protein [Zychaea mexicana]|uniref:alpha/beta hydrolase fold-domain-containing protein n=2 Tax=Zychaea mexicana TaxID=64656 RepID=UPI0022FDC10C|nr:alpha/beta hydrolase fold-domain-containing protein [Zychaea mexicana]XP_052981031.1 alpha/beta hydrolase fold-domain-containing protein [Zychaea mexicana]KAI9493372.1 alpha/beta hydrolase fold-domain-containing protein [Zychaea mexicana]KAI9494766.1 alpha/beta hydrolase fold-domain-containing protein [Zychaea mexicana]